MRSDAKERAYRKLFPWLNNYLPPAPSRYVFEKGEVDADVLDLFPSRDSPVRQIFLLNQSTGQIGEVRAYEKAHFFASLFGAQDIEMERVSQALERLGPAADTVNAILVMGKDNLGQRYATIYYTRASTTIARVWRKLAADEQAKIEKEIAGSFVPEASPATA